MNYQTMKTWRNFISILVSERNQSEMATYHVITWKRQNFGDSKKIDVFQRLWGRKGEMSRCNTEDF